MKILLFISCCALTVFLSSCDSTCSKKVACPGFEDTILTGWFPYKQGDKLKFVSGNQSQEFNLQDFFSTKPYTDSYHGCYATVSTSSFERDTVGFPKFEMDLQKLGAYYSSDVSREAGFRLLGLVFQGGFSDNGFISIAASQGLTGALQSYNSIQLNGKTFNRVQSIYFDTTIAKKPPVYKIYISRGQGIVAYETYGPSLLWVKE